MEWKMEWNEIFGMDYRRCQNGMEWNGRFQKWNVRQPLPIPYLLQNGIVATY